MRKASFGLFQRFGVELEYMLVDADTLDVLPQADRLIEAESGSVDGDVRRGAFEWSNELALHVIELKTGRPAARLAGLAEGFQSEVRHLNARLKELNARLLPTAMHPWMNPARESRLWPHSNGEIYAAFDRIFDCSGHGWTNLQSAHLNLPFRTAAEFRRLHTAVRLILPLLPALAASSPFIEGRLAPVLDMRLATYRTNCRRIPSITGSVIPERIDSPTAYRRKILQRIYRVLAPLDPDGVLQEEWANARGAIARFERNTIEVRLLDVQECPAVDLAIIQFVVALLRALTGGRLSSEEAQARPTTQALAGVLEQTIARGGGALVGERSILRALGIQSTCGLEVRGLLAWLLDAVSSRRDAWREIIAMILQKGTLSERILRATGTAPTKRRLKVVYRRLADCLARGETFCP